MGILLCCFALLCELKVVASLLIHRVRAARSVRGEDVSGTDALAAVCARVTVSDCGAGFYLARFGRSVRALQLLMDDRLGAGLSAGDVVAHGVQTRLGRVDTNDVLQLRLASRQLVLPVLARGLAFFEEKWFRVLALLEHLTDVSRRVKMRSVLVFVE